jgi:hypothetical protein
MNPRTWNLKWVAAFAAAALVGAVGVIAVLTVMGGDDGQATAEQTGETTPTVEPALSTAEPPLSGTDEPTPSAMEPYPYYPRQIPTLAPGYVVPEKRACPDRWQRVSNDLLNYSLCLPSDWGILDEETGERSTKLATRELTTKLLSPEGFPYPVGVPLDKLLQDPGSNLIWIQLSTASPNAGMACDAEPRPPLGSLPAVGCEVRFNYSDSGRQDFRSDGRMIEIDIVAPLPNSELDPVTSTARFGLHVAVVGSESAMEAHGKTLSQILDSLEGQP